MDAKTIFNRVLFSSFMEEIHDDFKRDIEEAGLSEHQMYMKFYTFDKLVGELVDRMQIKPGQLSDFVNEMMLSKRIYEVSGFNDANVYTGIMDFLKRAVEVLEDREMIGQIVPEDTLNSIFPTDDELQSQVAYFGEYCDGYTAEDESDIQNESPNVVEFFSGKSWREIGLSDETEIMRNAQWSDFDWNVWKHVREVGANEGLCQGRHSIFDYVSLGDYELLAQKQMAQIAAGAPEGAGLKEAAESVSKKSINPGLK